jgi:hypothetical protein
LAIRSLPVSSIQKSRLSQSPRDLADSMVFCVRKAEENATLRIGMRSDKYCVVYFISFIYYFGKSISKMNDELQISKRDFCEVQGIDS